MSVGHVAGPVASQALDALVGQFADRTSFVRELVQNSLDAGAGRVDLTFLADDGPLVIEVLDDGEGMDRQIIEECLLTLFRSSKERDLTKIGKFGVGFVSLFALDPERVVVDTARDGLHYRVVFARDRSFTLLEVDTPFEGTQVRIETRETGAKARALAERTHQALEYWCRFARADITSTCTAPSWGWDFTEVTGAFTIEAPVVVTIDEPGFRAVVGPSGGPEKVAFHNRGLTLLEAREPLIPGVSFRVEAATLEHTLTRDNVLRDGHFDDVIARLKALATGPLRERWTTALQAAVATGDHDRRRTLIACAHPATLPLPTDQPLIPTVGAGPVAVDDLRPKGMLAKARARLGKQPTHWCAEAPSALTQAAADADMLVLLGSADAPDLVLAARIAGVALVPLARDHRVAVPTDARPERVVAAAAHLPHDTVLAAHFEPPCPHLAVRQAKPGAVRTGLWSDDRGPVLVNLDHTLWAALDPLPPALAGALLARAVGAELDLAPVSDALFGTLADTVAPAQNEEVA